MFALTNDHMHYEACSLISFVEGHGLVCALFEIEKRHIKATRILVIIFIIFWYTVKHIRQKKDMLSNTSLFYLKNKYFHLFFFVWSFNINWWYSRFLPSSPTSSRSFLFRFIGHFASSINRNSLLGVLETWCVRESYALPWLVRLLCLTRSCRWDWSTGAASELMVPPMFVFAEAQLWGTKPTSVFLVFSGVNSWRYSVTYVFLVQSRVIEFIR